MAYAGVFYGRMGPTILLLFAVGAVGLVERDRARGAPGLGTVAFAWWFLPMPMLAMLVPLAWHHFRYVMPYLVIFVPLAALGAAAVDRMIARLRGLEGPPTPYVLGVLLVTQAFAGFAWTTELAQNARDIRGEHVDTARWLAANTPPDTVVAANDVGTLAYLGERRILDLEGIVSPSALPDALAGQGSVYETLVKHPPSLFVGYPGWYGSAFEAGVFHIQRHARILNRSIAGGDDLTVATIDSAVMASGARPPRLLPGQVVLDTLNVSDRTDEAAHAFAIVDDPPYTGRANTVVLATYADGTRVVDGARRLPDSVAFTMERGAGPAALVGRFGANERAMRLLVRVDGQDVGVWSIPAVAERVWEDHGFVVPAGTGRVAFEILPIDGPSTVGSGWEVGRFWTVTVPPTGETAAP
jgi:hypothetical protein